jgi:hypothetical protein
MPIRTLRGHIDQIAHQALISYSEIHHHNDTAPPFIAGWAGWWTMVKLKTTPVTLVPPPIHSGMTDSVGRQVSVDGEIGGMTPSLRATARSCSAKTFGQHIRHRT